jgi:2-polyprenyl-6-methoxyphenol hydroxylase-like FAD-dependent oxidoreductase
VSKTAHDVVIAGGGPAGCAAALALARHGVTRIVLVDAARPAGRRIGESLPPDARLLLARLGVLQSFLAAAHEPCLGSCSSWGSDELGYNDFLLNPHGTGWHLDRRRFETMLLDEVIAAGVEVRRDRFDGSIAARYTVDATGMKAVVARDAGARRRFVDRLVCVCGYFDLGEATAFPRLTLLEAVEAGWWYAARLPDGEAVVAFASDVETVRRLGAARPERWRALLAETRHVAAALAGCPFLPESLRVHPAPSFVLDRAARGSWIAVGDAASSYDPLSAQGIYKALDDGLRAAEAIAAALDGKRSAFDDYHDSVAARFEQYLASCRYFYGIEQRFPESGFWRRRKAV